MNKTDRKCKNTNLLEINSSAQTTTSELMDQIVRLSESLTTCLWKKNCLDKLAYSPLSLFFTAKQSWKLKPFGYFSSVWYIQYNPFGRYLDYTSLSKLQICYAPVSHTACFEKMKTSPHAELLNSELLVYIALLGLCSWLDINSFLQTKVVSE